MDWGVATMALGRTYKCSVTGFNHEGRAAYIKRHLHAGSSLNLVREPHNPHDSLAVAVYHGGHKIGYIPARKRWVAKSLDEGNEHAVEVFEVDIDEGDLLGLYIDITIIKAMLPRQTLFERLIRLLGWS